MKKSFFVAALSVFLLSLSACDLTVPDSSSTSPAGPSSTSEPSPITSTSQSGESSNSSESSSSSGESSSSEVVTQYTITYSAGEGTGTMNPVVVDAGSEHTLLPCGFTREGYHFDYWQVGNDAAHKAAGDKVTVNDNVTVTAEWAQDEPAPVKTLVSIDVANTKTEYTVGDEFDNSALTITGNYSDETQEVIPASGYTVTGFDSSIAVASQELTVTVKETTISKKITISIVEPTPAFVPGIFVSNDNWETQTKVDLVPGTSAGTYVKENYELHVGESFYVQAAPEKWFHFSDATFGGAYSTSCFVAGASDNLNVAKAGKYTFLISPDLNTFVIASDYDQEDYVVVGIQGQSPKSLTYNATLGAFTASVSGVAGKQVGVKIGDAEYYNETDKMYLHGKLPAVNNLEYSTDKYLIIHDVTDAKIEVYLGEGGAISVFLETQVEEHYFVVGTIGGADKWSSTDYELIENPEKAGEYYLSELITLKAGDGIKVRNFDPDTWYPDGMDNEKIVSEDGKYQIYFRPDGQGGEDWYEGYLYVQKQETPVEPEYSKYEVVINGIATELVEYEYVLPEVKPADVKAQYYLGEDNVIDVTEGNSIVFKGYKESAYEELPAYTPNGDDMTNHIYNNVIEEGGVLKIRRTSAEAKVYLILHTDDSYSFWISEGGAMAVLEDGYYITGTMNGWAPTAAYRLNEKGAITVALHQGDQFLIVQKDGDNMYYYKNIPADSGSDKATTYKNSEGSALYNGYILALEDHNFQAVVPGSYFIEYAESGIWTELWYLDPEHKDTSPLLLDKLQVAVNEGEYADIDKFGKVGENIQYEYTANITKDAIYHFRWASGETVNLELGNTATPFFTLGGDGSYVVAKSSTENVTFYFVLSADKITLYASIPAGPSIYALVGTMNGWNETDTTYAFTPTGENEVSLLGVNLSEANKFKVVIDGTWTGCLSYENLSEATKALKINEEFAFLDKDGNDHNIEVENSRIYNIVINTESGEITITVVQVTITQKASNEGEAIEIKLDKGQNYVLPANPYDVPAGKKFEGWTIGEATRQPGYVLENVQEDVLMVALWAQLYTVSFNVNGGTGTMEPVQVEAGDYQLPANGFTAPDGKQFKAWLVGDDQYQPGDIITIEGATNVTAIWQLIPETKYTVTYKANGGQGDNVVVENISGSYELAANTFAAPDNMKFKCWSVNDVEKAAGSSIDVEANTEVLAVWENEYTISFAANGGTGSMDQVKQVAGTYHLPANGFTAPEGYKFAGWKIGTDETIRAAGYAYTVSSNVTITAQWEALPPSAPEKSIWLGRNDIWSKVADLVDNPSAEGELMALNVELQAGDEFVVRVLGDTYLKYISGGAKDNFTFDGESNIVVKAGMGATYNFYVYDNLTKLNIERVATTTGIEATYNQDYVFVGETVTTRGSVTIKYVRDDASKVEISSEDYNNVKYYSNEACTDLVDVEYVFTEEDRGNLTVYAKLGDYKTSFSFEVISNTTYNVTFEMDLSVVKSWDKTSNFSLYVFGNDKYQPMTWDECMNNIDSGSVTFNILEGKDITGAVFYFEQDGELKQSTDMAVTITEAGTYTVNFVSHWDKFIIDEKEVWKLDEMTITQKVLTVNKNSLTIEKEEVDESVVASSWVGPLTATSNQPDVASVTIDAKSGVATITGNGIGDAVITISDGTTNKVVNVTVEAVVEKYTVTYQANGGTGADVVVNDIFGSYNLKNENPFTAPDGKQFKAWLIGETEYALGSEITVSANTTVKAVWEDIPAVTYYLVGKIGGDSDKWSSTDYGLVASGNPGEYVLSSNIALNKNDELKVKSDTEWFPKDAGNKFVNVPGLYQVHFFPGKGSGEHDWDAENYFYLELVETTFTWTVDWVWNDDNVLLAWVWGGTFGDGAWVATTKVGDKSASVNLGNATGCKFVRFNKGTTTSNADWDKKNNESNNADMSNYTVSWN